MSAFNKIYGHLKIIFGGNKTIEISQDGTNSTIKGDDPFIFENVSEVQFPSKTLKGFLEVDLTISVADWSGGTSCTKAVTGVTTTSKNQFAIESLANVNRWADANIVATGQALNQITFECETTPTEDITFKVLICLI